MTWSQRWMKEDDPKNNDLTLSALRGGRKFAPPYENPLSYFCEWVIFFQLLMTFQFETSNICWLGKIICLTWKKLRNPGSNISSLLIYLSDIQCPKWSANPITVTPIWKLRLKSDFYKTRCHIMLSFYVIFVPRPFCFYGWTPSDPS